MRKETYMLAYLLVFFLLLSGCQKDNARNQNQEREMIMQQDWEKQFQKEQERLRLSTTKIALDDFLKKIPMTLKNWENAPNEWYGLTVLGICNLLNSAPYSGQSNAKETTWKLADETLKRMGDTLSVPIVIQLLHHSASETLYKRNDWPEIRLQRAQLWLETWSRLEREKDKDFNPENMPEVNVSPPRETGLPAGVSPESISDTTLRKEYLQAISKNQAYTEYYNYQFRLRQLEVQFKRIASAYLISSYSKPPKRFEEINKLLTAYLAASKESEEIIQAIKEKW